MPRELSLPLSAHAWGRDDFAAVLKRELEALPPHELPLQEALAGTSHLAPEPHRVRVIHVDQVGTSVRVRVGVFYAGVVAGCSCADDPTPVESQPEYCELELVLNPANARASVTPRDG